MHSPTRALPRPSGFDSWHVGGDWPVRLKLRSGETVDLSYEEARQLATDLGEAANWEGNEHG